MEQVWTLSDYQPNAQIVFRSHVHVHVFSGRILGTKMQYVATTPALQAMGSKFGARRCSSLVDFGFMHVDVHADGKWEMPVCHWAHVKAQKATALTL